jgi:hypothetical protein
MESSAPRVFTLFALRHLWLLYLIFRLRGESIF